MPSWPAHPAGTTIGPAGTIRKLHAGVRRHPFVGAGPYRLLCPAAPAAACNGGHAHRTTAHASTAAGPQSVRSAQFLDTARFPVLSFRDGLVGGDGRSVLGALTVREVCRPVSLSIDQVTVAGQSFTASAAVRIDRTEFGVTALPGLAGRYLDLTVEVRCVRK